MYNLKDVKNFVTMATFSVPDSFKVTHNSLNYSAIVGVNQHCKNLNRCTKYTITRVFKNPLKGSGTDSVVMATTFLYFHLYFIELHTYIKFYLFPIRNV